MPASWRSSAGRSHEAASAPDARHHALAVSWAHGRELILWRRRAPEASSLDLLCTLRAAMGDPRHQLQPDAMAALSKLPDQGQLLLPGLRSYAFDLSGTGYEGGTWYDALLGGMFNFTATPTVLESIAWVAYVVPVLVLFLRPVRRSAPAPKSEPAPTTS